MDEVPADLYQYTFRLGFHLMKEYPTSLLFRGGCPATGECIYTLIDKASKKVIKQFDGAIMDDPEEYGLDYIVSISENSELVVYSIKNGRTVSKRIDVPLTMIYPQWHFGNIKLLGNQIQVIYHNEDKFRGKSAEEKGKKEISIDISTIVSQP